MSPLRKETDVARLAAEYFTDLGWNLAYEVEVPGLKGRPDIVGVQGPLTLIVECKTSIGIAVMGQAAKHIGYASYVYVATPTQHTREGRYVEGVLRRDGIGWLAVGVESTRELVRPRLQRQTGSGWRKHLRPEHSTALAPGSAGGGYWTPFAETCRNVAAFVAAHPGCTTSEVVKNVQHHYRRNATAVSCLARWGREGVIKGVAVEGNTWTAVAS